MARFAYLVGRRTASLFDKLLLRATPCLTPFNSVVKKKSLEERKITPQQKAQTENRKLKTENNNKHYRSNP
jgi:hypothetical protein